MGYSARDILTRFTRYAGLPDGTEPGAKPWTRITRFPDGSGSSLYYAKDRQNRVVEVQSYGSHFPLARLQLTSSGRRRRWLLNGDWYSGQSGWGHTNNHNTMMRELAQASGTPWFIIPFSAVVSAGIDMDTIRPVQVSPERWTWEERTAATLDQVPTWEQSIRAYRTAGGQVLYPPRDPQLGTAFPRDGGWHYSTQTALDGFTWVPADGPAYEGDLELISVDIEPGPGGLYHWRESRHWLGESLFRATYQAQVPRKHPIVHRTARGTVSWVDRSFRVKRSALFVAAFDRNEPVPLWFMSELPHGVRVTTIDAAIDALKPDRVREAEAEGTPVYRQGDIFAIGASVSTALLRQAGTRLPQARSGLGRPVLGTNHTATDAYEVPASAGWRDAGTYARGFLRHRPQDRRPDHQTVKLGDRQSWFVLVTNTVPRSFSMRSWSMGGRVD
jgi:hypothetical protein